MSERVRPDLGDNKTLSHSRRTTFRRCRRLYYLQYIIGLRPKETPAPLRMGSIYSDALEAGNAEVAQSQYSELVAQAMHDSEYFLAEKLLDELAVVKPMAQTYIEHVMLPDIDREVGFVGYEFGGYQDNGFIDGLGMPLGNDHYLLVENKLKGRFGAAEEKALVTDEQLLGYIKNICLMFETVPEKVDVRYEVAKKPALRQGKNETREVFRARVTNDILTNPSKYHIVIDGEGIKRTQAQIEQWVDGFDRMAYDLAEEGDMLADPNASRLAYPMNRDACFMYGGCEMLGICGAKSEEEAALYIEKSFITREQREEARKND